MKFLRTASTNRLLAVIVSVIVVIAGGTAIAVAASGSGPVPKRQPLANAIHQALAAPATKGITADIRFTNNLIDSSDFAGEAKDPILQGATGRLWLTEDHMRLELQSDNGDAQVLVNGRSFWISDPNAHTLYKGTLPADTSKSSDKQSAGIPTVAQIQQRLTKLVSQVDVSGAQPTDVAGRAAYRVVVSPKHDGGLLGSARLAWDALAGTPLEIGIYAKGNSTPVIDLKATNISYGSVPASNFAVTPPAGEKVVQVSDIQSGKRMKGPHAKHAEVAGAAAVASRVPFTLTAPRSLVGLPRHDVSLLNWGGKPAALVTYGRGVGGMAIIEQKADAKRTGSAAGSGSRGANLSLPTVSINGATGQELTTALGTVLHFSRGTVAYTVIGSVPGVAAEQAARALSGS
jgi:outer membrane lipoprotein-sorting protein